MQTVTASEARQTLPAQLDRIEAGEQIAISRHGRVVALLVSPDSARSARTRDTWERADALDALLASARDRDLPSAAVSPERAQEMVAEIRRDRNER